MPDSPAANALCDEPGVPKGLRPGDKILEVDGHPVTRFNGMNGSVVWYVVRSEGTSIPFKVQRGGQTLTFEPVPLAPEAASGWQRKGLREVLIDPAFTSIVGEVKPGSPAQKAGLRKDDIIRAANGQPLLHPLGLSEDVEQQNYGQPIKLTVERAHQTLELELPAMPFKIGDVYPGSPADRAGLKEGDTIEAINGAPARKFSDLKGAILAHPGEPLTLSIVHDGTRRDVSVTPLVPITKTQPPKTSPMIGIGPASNLDGIALTNGGTMKIVPEKPLDQIRNSVATIGNTLGAVLARKSHIGVQHLGGPIFIGRTYYYLLSSREGWRLALWFSVILNVNLALLNMLPIPVLDGGHILLALIEMVRRKPVNIRVLEVVQTACFFLIAGYMLYVSFYDVGDLASGHKSQRELEFPSPTPPAAQP